MAGTGGGKSKTQNPNPKQTPSSQIPKSGDAAARRFCAGHALAQTSGESRDATLRKLLERVESLETEVRQLRAEKTPATAASGKQTVAFAEGAVAAMDDAPARGTFPQLKLRGFGDVEYRWADGGKDRNAFRLGALDLFLTSQLSENLSVLSENVIEADDEEWKRLRQSSHRRCFL